MIEGLLIVAILGIAYLLLKKEETQLKYSCPYCDPTVWFATEAERDAHIQAAHSPVPPLPENGIEDGNGGIEDGEPPIVPPTSLTGLDALSGSVDRAWIQKGGVPGAYWSVTFVSFRVQNISSQTQTFVVGIRSDAGSPPYPFIERTHTLAPGAVWKGQEGCHGGQITAQINGVNWFYTGGTDIYRRRSVKVYWPTEKDVYF